MPIKNSISFQINDHLKGQDVVYKNNWPECSNLTMTPDAIKKQKYITSYSRCKVSPEGYIPEKIIIEYAPWLTYKDLIKKDMAFLKNYVTLIAKMQQKKASDNECRTGGYRENSSHSMETHYINSPSTSGKI